MSGKNRAFALAIATAALGGFCAPMASAATGPNNTGFNGDSILNLSGNQLPINACGNQIPIQGIGAQVPLQNITAMLGLGNTNDQNTSTNTEGCTNTPTETNTSNTNTAPMTSSDDHHNNNCNQCGGGSWSDPSSSDPSNTGFNNDSILKVTGNQLPVNICNNQVPIQLIGAQ